MEHRCRYRWESSPSAYAILISREFGHADRHDVRRRFPRTSTGTLAKALARREIPARPLLEVYLERIAAHRADPLAGTTSVHCANAEPSAVAQRPKAEILLRLLGQIGMRAAEVGGRRILTDLDDAAADGA